MGPALLVSLSVIQMAATADARQNPLRRGSTGVEVSAWQQALRRVGAPVPVDGIFGALTLEATRDFQRQDSNVLEADGIVNLDDVKALLGMTLTCCGAGYPEISRGVISPGVGWLQLSLNRWLRRQGRGHPTLNVDMIFGPRTEAAVRLFQETNGIEVDGVAGQVTWTALADRNFTHFP